MKKHLLAVALAASATIAGAQSFQNLEIFSHTFTKDSQTIAPFTEWESTGTLNNNYAQYYRNGWGIVTLNNGSAWIGSCSSFADENQAADTGLVTPVISVPECGAMLQFQAVNIDSEYHNVPNILDIYVSTTGNSKEDFTKETLLTTRRLPAMSQSGGPTFVDGTISLSAYAGKDVYIAFVNRTTNGGLMLINDFRVDTYMAEFSITSPQLYTAPGAYNIACSFKLRTPIPCKGYTAELIVGDKVVSTSTSTRALESAYNTYRVAFRDAINIAMNERVEYTVRVKPNVESIPAIEYKDFIVCTEGFPQVIVEEEGTGEYCGFCPIAQAFLAYFADKYPEQFIGIAVHGGFYATGVMTAPNYSEQVLGYYNTAGYPFAMLNRSVQPVANQFNSLNSYVTELLAQRSSIKVDINRTVFYENENKMTVHFTPVTCADTENASYRAAVVLTADGLVGPTDSQNSEYKNWIQYNNYSGKTLSGLKAYGITADNEAELKPYYQKYTSAPAAIQNMVYDHVGMGCWPDWAGKGCPLNAQMSTANPDMYSITFDVPMQKTVGGFGVQDIKKTAVVVLIFDQTGTIVTAKRMPYESFEVSTAGVDAVDSATSMRAVRAADHIALTAPAGTLVELFAIDGTRLARKVMSSETDEISPLGYKGLVVVRMTNGNDSYFNKVIF